MQIPPGQAALSPSPAPPVAPAPQVVHAEVIEPVRRVTPSREGAETDGKTKPRLGAQATQRSGHRETGRGQIIDLLV